MLYEESPKTLDEIQVEKEKAEKERENFFIGLKKYGWISLVLMWASALLMKFYGVENITAWFTWNAITSTAVALTWGMYFILKYLMVGRNVFNDYLYKELGENKNKEILALVSPQEMAHWRIYVDDVKRLNRKFYVFEYIEIKENFGRIFSDAANKS